MRFPVKENDNGDITLKTQKRVESTPERVFQTAPHFNGCGVGWTKQTHLLIESRYFQRIQSNFSQNSCGNNCITSSDCVVNMDFDPQRFVKLNYSSNYMMDVAAAQ